MRRAYLPRAVYDMISTSAVPMRMDRMACSLSFASLYLMTARSQTVMEKKTA